MGVSTMGAAWRGEPVAGRGVCMGVRWVCLSDLHLGALNSVLTAVAVDGESVDKSVPSPVLTALCDGLRTLAPTGDPPELVILGDLFELALSSTDQAAATFAHLVRGLRPGEVGAAVSPLLRFVPGNHDHHLWRRARGEWYLDHIETLPAAQELPPEAYVTSLLPAHQRLPVRDRLIELLASRAETGAKVSVEQSYPNVGMASASGERVVVLSHGHFIEPLYRAMSGLTAVFGRGTPGSPSLESLEAHNGPWIDFFWSSMGDAAGFSTVARGLYESLQSEEAIEAELAAIRRTIARRPEGHLRHHLEGLFAAEALGELLKRSFKRERHVADVLSDTADSGLRDFLSGPVAKQVGEEVGSPREAVFVFGHTHKPFTETRTVARLAPSVSVVNTGGWVVDSPVPEPNKGASVVLVDDRLDVAVLRVYDQGTGPAAVRLETLPGEEDNPLVGELRELVDPGRDPWLALAQAAAASQCERRGQLEHRLRTQTDELEHGGRR